MQVISAGKTTLHHSLSADEKENCLSKCKLFLRFVFIEASRFLIFLQKEKRDNHHLTQKQSYFYRVPPTGAFEGQTFVETKCAHLVTTSSHTCTI